MFIVWGPPIRGCKALMFLHPHTSAPWLVNEVRCSFLSGGRDWLYTYAAIRALWWSRLEACVSHRHANWHMHDVAHGGNKCPREQPTPNALICALDKDLIIITWWAVNSHRVGNESRQIGCIWYANVFQTQQTRRVTATEMSPWKQKRGMQKNHKQHGDDTGQQHR